MLTRRHIRVKVMQSIYAMHQDQTHNLQREEKFLLKSMGDMQKLFITLMGLWKGLHQRGEELLDIAQKKYLATTRDKEPNRKFVENKALKIIIEDKALNELIEQECPIDWQLHNEYINLIFKQITENKLYTKYMESQKTDFVTDKYLLADLFREVIAPDDKLYDFLQDGSMTWMDDLPSVNTLIMKLLKGIKEENPSNYFIPKLYKDESDKTFAIDLLRKAVLNDEKYHEYLKDKTPNWDITRLAEIDTILIKMAIAEFLKFPSIPVKVTLNEYVEIAKEYSTPRSSVFINGILDKLSKDFAEKEMLNKIGRGLI